MEAAMHRDALGMHTAEPMRFTEATCGHYVRTDMMHDEPCPFCIEYEEAITMHLVAEADRSLFG